LWTGVLITEVARALNIKLDRTRRQPERPSG
jgi:hypothetical protein